MAIWMATVPATAAARGGWSASRAGRSSGFGADRERVTQLEEGEHREHHRLPGPVATDREGLDGEGHPPMEPYPECVLPQATGEDRLAHGPWRTAHGVRLRGLDTEGEPRQAVGHEVDPQDVHRQERNREPDERGQEHDPDLPELLVSRYRTNRRMLS